MIGLLVILRKHPYCRQMRFFKNTSIFNLITDLQNSFKMIIDRIPPTTRFHNGVIYIDQPVIQKTYRKSTLAPTYSTGFPMPSLHLNLSTQIKECLS